MRWQFWIGVECGNRCGIFDFECGNTRALDFVKGVVVSIFECSNLITTDLIGVVKFLCVV